MIECFFYQLINYQKNACDNQTKNDNYDYKYVLTVN